MDFFELIQKRYSVRAYKPDPVDEATLARILEAARMAPTAANCQPFQLIVAYTKGREEEMKRVYNRPWFIQAPLIICACGLPDRGWVRRMDAENLTHVDVGIVMDHLILAAANLGLGTCWIADFDIRAVREVFDLPSDVEPVVLTPLGFPADEPKLKSRKSIKQLVRYERW
jgi:nitroreductase